MDGEKLLSIASDYIKKHHPDWSRSIELPSLITDEGDYWQVTFKLPEDRIGGVPVIRIEKDSLKVVGAYHTQ